MKQTPGYSDRWRDLKSDFNTPRRSFFRDSGPKRNFTPPDQRADNTRLLFKDNLDAPPAFHGILHGPDTLSELWKQQDLKAYHIVLLFTAKKAEPLLKTIWHLSQRTVFRSDGYAIIEFHVRNLSALKPWLKHLEPNVQIIRTLKGSSNNCF